MMLRSYLYPLPHLSQQGQMELSISVGCPMFHDSGMGSHTCPTPLYTLCHWLLVHKYPWLQTKLLEQQGLREDTEGR